MKQYRGLSVVISLFAICSRVFADNTTEAELQAIGQILPPCSVSHAFETDMWVLADVELQVECIRTLAPQHNCSKTDAACTCVNADLNAAVVQCITGTCTIKETLATLKFSADACEVPVRDKGPLTRAVCWSLFGLSLLAIALRLVARSPWSGGPGYGWDDWTMLFVLSFLIPHEVGLEISTNGDARRFWEYANVCN